jgi:predicted CXXCH cytochrome family protein
MIFGRGGAESTMMLNPNHECSFCHDLHTGASGEFPLGIDAQAETACMSCHGPAAPGSAGGGSDLKAEVHTNDSQNSCCDPFRITCLNCHDPHDEQTNFNGRLNIKLVRAVVLAEPPSGGQFPRTAIFESIGGSDPEADSFCDNTADSSGVYLNVCDTCHEVAEGIGRHRRNSSQQHHQNGATCTRSGCHTHAGTFNP